MPCISASEKCSSITAARTSATRRKPGITASSPISAREASSAMITSPMGWGNLRKR